jgi:hypothetical protein
VLCAALDLDWLDVDQRIDHQPSFKALEISALNGCHICALFHDAILQRCVKPYFQINIHKGTKAPCYLKVRDGWQPFQVSVAKHYNHEGVGFNYERRHPRDPANFPATIDKINEDRLTEVISAFLPLYSLRGDNSPTTVERPVLTSPSLELCKRWLHSCSQEHGDCGPITDQPLPTRLIDIGWSRIKLLETNDKYGQYVTLSHCWGGVKPLMTVQANYEQHLCEIRKASQNVSRCGHDH